MKSLLLAVLIVLVGIQLTTVRLFLVTALCATFPQVALAQFSDVSTPHARQILEERATTAPDQAPPIVLFDGVCNLCDGFVNFVMDRDSTSVVKFAALQSEAGRELLIQVDRANGLDGSLVHFGESLESVVLVVGNRYYTHSEVWIFLTVVSSSFSFTY